MLQAYGSGSVLGADPTLAGNTGSTGDRATSQKWDVLLLRGGVFTACWCDAAPCTDADYSVVAQFTVRVD